MASEQPEARIIVRDSPDGKKEISLYDPQNGREHRTGTYKVASGRDADRAIEDMKKRVERSGSRATVKEM